MGHRIEEPLLGTENGPPTARRFIAMLETLESKQDAEAEWRKLEQHWLATLLQQKIIAFDDAKVAAELVARHGWENAGTGSLRGRTAFLRLQELRQRRGADALSCWETMS